MTEIKDVFGLFFGAFLALGRCFVPVSKVESTSGWSPLYVRPPQWHGCSVASVSAGHVGDLLHPPRLGE